MDGPAEGVVGIDRLAGGDQVAHALQRVERLLHDAERVAVGRLPGAADAQQQRLKFVGQIAHGGDAGHARTTLEGVQHAGQRCRFVAVGRRGAHAGKRGIGRLEEFGGLLAEDRGDFGVVARFGRRHSRAVRRRGDGCHGADRRYRGHVHGRHCGPGLHQQVGREKVDGRFRQHRHLGGARLVARHQAARADLAVGIRVQPLQAQQQIRLRGEERRLLVEVLGDVLHAVGRIGQRPAAAFGQAKLMVIELADVVVQRHGKLDALACRRHLRGTGQRVARAVQRIGDREGREASVAVLEKGRNRRQVPGNFLAVDVTEDRILAGRRHGLGDHRRRRRLGMPGAGRLRWHRHPSPPLHSAVLARSSDANNSIQKGKVRSGATRRADAPSPPWSGAVAHPALKGCLWLQV